MARDLVDFNAVLYFGFFGPLLLLWVGRILTWGNHWQIGGWQDWVITKSLKENDYDSNMIKSRVK